MITESQLLTSVEIRFTKEGKARGAAATYRKIIMRDGERIAPDQEIGPFPLGATVRNDDGSFSDYEAQPLIDLLGAETANILAENTRLSLANNEQVVLLDSADRAIGDLTNTVDLKTAAVESLTNANQVLTDRVDSLVAELSAEKDARTADANKAQAQSQAQTEAFNSQYAAAVAEIERLKALLAAQETGE
jgi:hypothetical protein